MPPPTLVGQHGIPFGDAIFSQLSSPKAIELDSGGSMPVSQEGYRKTYTACFTAFTPVAAPTDIINLFGSASVVIRVKRVYMNVITDSAVATKLEARLAKRSTAGTLGSAVLTGLTAVPHRSSLATVATAAASGVASSVGTANYTTLGTLTGYVREQYIMPQLGTYTATNFPGANVVDWRFGENSEEPIMLLSAIEQVGINMAGGTLTGTCLFGGFITWVEESTSYV